MSVGFVAAQPARCAELLGGWLARLRQRLCGEPVLHADETTHRVNGALPWLHVCSTRWLTLLTAQRRSGQTAIKTSTCLEFLTLDTERTLRSRFGVTARSYWRVERR